MTLTGRGEQRKVMIAVQCEGIGQARRHLDRTAKPMQSIEQQRGTWSGNRSGVYN